MRRFAIAAAVVLGVLALAPTARADNLAEGKTAYAFALKEPESTLALERFQECVGKLRAILYPEPKRTEAEVKEARAYLAACHFHSWIATSSTDETSLDNAKDEVVELVRLDADYKLIGDLARDDAFQEFFIETGREVREELLRLERAEEAAKAATRAALRAEIEAALKAEYAAREPPAYKITPRRDRSFEVWQFIPGGVGQFYNGDYVLGTVLAIAEITALTVNAYTYRGFTFFLREPRISEGGTCGFERRRDCPHVNGRVANSFRVANFISFGVLAGAVVGGVLHAVLLGKKVRRTEEMSREEKIDRGLWTPPDSDGSEGDDDAEGVGDDGSPGRIPDEMIGGSGHHGISPVPPPTRWLLVPTLVPTEGAAAPGVSLRVEF